MRDRKLYVESIDTKSQIETKTKTKINQKFNVIVPTHNITQNVYRFGNREEKKMRMQNDA